MTKEEYILREGIRFRKEVPSTEIKQDAIFYAFIQPTLNGAVSQFYEQDVRMLSARRPYWGPESPYRIRVEIPPEIGPWHMELITCPPEAIMPMLSNFSVEGAYADWVPDIWSSHLGLIVTAPVRQLIEENDPDFHYFFPICIRVAETGDALPEERFYWVPRRRIWFWRDPEAAMPPGESAAWIEGGFSGLHEVWQYRHNSALRDFLAELPFWTEGLATYSFAMSRPVFRQLKSKKFTGLLELECKDKYDEDCDRSHNVGHF